MGIAGAAAVIVRQAAAEEPDREPVPLPAAVVPPILSPGPVPAAGRSGGG
jgi:hypothetical protein